MAATVQPMKLAVIGGGPSAFYVSSRILSLASNNPNIRIHAYDRLWSPHGLVRYGVAPDHPEVKNCTHKFDQTALDSRFKFFGNVNIGSVSSSVSHAINLPLTSLFREYSHILFSTGCTIPRPHPRLPFSQNCIPALDLVHWYTSHPSLSPSYSPPISKGVKRVSIIGNGNVALDIARMLLTNPEHLKVYDVPDPVLDILRSSWGTIEEVEIIGRRGLLEAAFTTKEAREMLELPEASMEPLPEHLFVTPEGEKLTRQQKRSIDLLKKGSKQTFGSTPKKWRFSFLQSPLSFQDGVLEVEHTRIDPETKRAISTGEKSQKQTDLVIQAIGFEGEPLSVPFEANSLEGWTLFEPKLGHLRTLANRVVSPNGKVIKNVYASGWGANGAKGVLASTMIDAYAAADTILNDLLPISIETTPLQPPPTQPEEVMDHIPLLDPVDSSQLDTLPREIESGLKDGNVTTYDNWKKIDAEEVRRGENLGKERERFGSWDNVKSFLGQS